MSTQSTPETFDPAEVYLETYLRGRPDNYPIEPEVQSILNQMATKLANVQVSAEATLPTTTAAIVALQSVEQ